MTEEIYRELTKKEKKRIAITCMTAVLEKCAIL